MAAADAFDNQPSHEDGSFEALKTRLDEIVSLVSDDDLPLEEALDLYEEAVGIGLQASQIMEKDIEARRAQEQETSQTQSQSVPNAPAPAASQDNGADHASEPSQAVASERSGATNQDAFTHSVE